jgi:hypothetical protein
MVTFAAIQKLVWFWLSYPFEMLAFQWRKRRDWQRIVPPLWLSPGELMASDLEQYVSGEGKGKIDAAFIDGIVKTRDETLSLIKKQLIISFLIFLFLFGNFIDIGIDLNISGFSLKYGKGIPEGLMLLSNLLSAYYVNAPVECLLDGFSDKILRASRATCRTEAIEPYQILPSRALRRIHAV